MKPWMRLGIGLVGGGGLMLLAACGPNHPHTYMPRPAPTPPAYPASVPTPLDPALRSAARLQLREQAHSNDPVLRAQALEAMRDAIGPPAEKEIVRHFDDPSPAVRFSALMAAGSLRLADIRPQLLQLADDSDLSVQVAARFALHRIGDHHLSHDLEKFAANPNPMVRGNTVLILGLLGEPSALNILRPMAGDANAAVRLQVAEAMWRLGNKEGLENLVAASISSYPDDKCFALLALAEPRDQRVIEHIRGELVTDWPEVNLVAARAMGMLGSDEGYGIALNGAKSKDPRQRYLAALAFGAIGRSDAQPDLAELLRDPAPSVRLTAASAILELK